MSILMSRTLRLRRGSCLLVVYALLLLLVPQLLFIFILRRRYLTQLLKTCEQKFLRIILKNKTERICFVLQIKKKNDKYFYQQLTQTPSSSSSSSSESTKSLSLILYRLLILNQ